jgi:hypothetical protein
MRRTILVQESGEWYCVPFWAQKKEFYLRRNMTVAARLNVET